MRRCARDAHAAPLMPMACLPLMSLPLLRAFDVMPDAAPLPLFSRRLLRV